MNARLDSLTHQLSQNASDWPAVLRTVLDAFSCQSGTLHRLDADTNRLALLTQVGIPDFLLDKIQLIPIGKGIAGCAAERKGPVQMCNLQTDTSGVARPDAKQTKVEGALAVPMLRQGEVIGVLGIGKMQPYEFSAEEIADLEAAAAKIAGVL